MWQKSHGKNLVKASYFNGFQLFDPLEIGYVFNRFVCPGLVDAQTFQQPPELLRAEA